MSTNYHIAIVNGDSRKNDAAIWNDPLGQLDAQITANSAELIAARGGLQNVDARLDALATADSTLDDRIDDLIIASGTSDAETIAARTAINYGSAPATLGAALGYAAGKVHNVLAYGMASGNSAAANTTALQAAINAATGTYGIVSFPSDGASYQVNKVTIDGSVIIEGNGAQLIGNADTIFGLSADITSLTIRGFRAAWNGLTGGVQHAKQFFTNGTNNIDTIGAYSTTFYDCGKLLIDDCDLGYLKISIYDDGATWPTVRNCKWSNTVANPLPNPHCLLIAGQKGATVTNCHFDVYLADSSNADVVKFEGVNSKSIVFDGNYLRNSNPASYAQLDMYNGGNRAHISNNTFINVGLMRKQVGGGPTVIDVSFDKIIDNHFEIEGTPTYPGRFIDFNGALAIISRNTFKGDGLGTAGAIAIEWNQKESTQHPLGSKWPMGLVVTENLCTGAVYFIKSNIGAGDTDIQGRSVISNNVIWDAQRIFYVGGGSPDPTGLAITGNYWLPSVSPNGQIAGIDDSSNQVFGNAVDQTLGNWLPAAALGGLATAARYRSGSITLDNGTASTLTGCGDRGALILWTGSAANEAAIVLFRATSSSNYCAVLAQTGSMIEAATGGTPPTGTSGTDLKITVYAGTNDTVYVENRRGGTRAINWISFAGA